jgi:hypothetical protein
MDSHRVSEVLDGRVWLPIAYGGKAHVELRWGLYGSQANDANSTNPRLATAKASKRPTLLNLLLYHIQGLLALVYYFGPTQTPLGDCMF